MKDSVTPSTEPVHWCLARPEGVVISPLRVVSVSAGEKIPGLQMA